MLAGALALSLLSASAGPFVFDPPEPRLGDLAVAYLKNDDPALTRAAVRVFGYEFVAFRVSDELLRAVLAVPMDIAPGDHPISFVLPTRTELGTLKIVSREFDRGVLKVSAEFTKKKSKELVDRLAREERELRALFEKEPGPPLFDGTLSRPVPGGITAVFGTRRIFNGQTNSIHYGLDLDAKTGVPIRSMAAGKVVMSAMRWASGGTVIVDHGGGLFTAYFHMSKRQSAVGEKVKGGKVLGLAGKTGRVTGPHLHLGVLVRAKKLDGGPASKAARSFFVDPQPFLDMAFAGGTQPLDTKPRTIHVHDAFEETSTADLPEGEAEDR